MGIYVLNVDEHPPFGKVKTLLRMGGRTIDKPRTIQEYVDAGEIPICVVENELWEAALVVSDDQQLWRTQDPDDTRPQTWLALPREIVIDRLGVQEDYL